MDAEAHTQQLLEHGYTLFEDAYDHEWVAAMRADMDVIHAELGSPSCYAPGQQELGPGIVLNAAGMVVRRLLHLHPRWARTLLNPKVVTALRGFLGQDMVLEIAGCVLSDKSRPFFDWHTHVYGIDDGEFHQADKWPTISRPERVVTLTYLQDLDDEVGPMLVLPRKVGEPIAPPFNPEDRTWDGQIEVRAAAGTTVVIDECTWHAVRPKLDDGLRMWVGMMYAARDAPVGGWTDHTLPRVAAAPEATQLLRSLLRPA